MTENLCFKKLQYICKHLITDFKEKKSFIIVISNVFSTFKVSLKNDTTHDNQNCNLKKACNLKHGRRLGM